MSSPVLDYGPQLPWRNRRRVRRAAVLIALAILICSAPWWGAHIYRHTKVLYWQHQCMNYKMPTGGIPAGTVPKEWMKYYEALTGGRPACDGTVFLGVLIRPDGQRRIVILDYNGLPSSSGDNYLIVRVIHPATLWRAAEISEDIHGYWGWTGVGWPPTREVYVTNTDQVIYHPAPQ